MLTPYEPFAARRSHEYPWQFYIWCPTCDRLTPYDIDSAGQATIGKCRKCGDPQELQGNEITMVKGCEEVKALPPEKKSPEEITPQFQSQLMQVVYQNPASREVMELALRYHNMCDMFDKTVCSMLAGDKTPMPANAEELRIINDHAQVVRRAVSQDAAKKGLDLKELAILIRKGSEYLKQHIKAMPEDTDAS
jgi:hypothetical protein